METSTKGRLCRSLSAVLAVLMIASAFVFCGGEGKVSAASKSDIEEFKNNSNVKKYQQNIADLEKKQENVQKQISALKGDLNDWREKKAYYDELLEICDEKLAAGENLKTELEARIDEVRADKEAKTKESEELYEQIKERLVVSYESGGSGITYLELLFSADNIIKFLMGLDQATSLLEYDAELMNDYERITAELSEEEALLNSDAEELDGLIASLNEERQNAEKLAAESDEMIDKAMTSLEASEKIMEDLDKEAKEANARLDDYIDELLKKQGVTQSVADGEFMWPLETRYTTITSSFGPRKNPFNPTSGKRQNHTGTDIGAPRGAKIFASNNGTVVKAEKDSSYGNYVMIDHGGGIFTLYAHCNKLLVSVGQYVTKGTVIAEVGSTGAATGPHLHFEVREGKTRVNAMTYVKKP